MTNLPGIRCPLFDLASWKNGLAFKKIDFSETGLPVIKIAELNNGISTSTSYTQGIYDSNVFIKKGDLLFSWSGNPQTSIDVYKYQLPNGWLNQHIFKVTANEDKVTKDFLYYLMKYLKPHFTQIAANKQTTGLGHVTIADLKRMSIVVPNMEVQRKIISILKAIDDKIELNNEINKDFYENEELIAITKELADTLRKNQTIDWQRRDSARAKMRMLIKKLLKKHRYPPEGMEDAVQTVMTQCELWTDNTDMDKTEEKVVEYSYQSEANLSMVAQNPAQYGLKSDM